MSGDAEPQVAEAYGVMAELGIVLGAAPISKFEACWECVIDEYWTIAVNGHKEPKRCSLTDVPIAPFNCYVQFNGWPAGILTPFGGIIAAGTDANEDAFIDAMRARIDKEKT